MKYYSYLAVTIVLLFAFGCSGERTVQITVTNPSDAERLNEPVVIDYKKLSSAYAGIKLDKVVIADDAGNILPTQVDDLNGDGKLDELVFLADFAQKQTRVFKCRYPEPGKEPSAQTVHAAIWKKSEENYIPASDVTITDDHQRSDFRYEGVGWESADIGYRLYLDERNATDIFGKHQPGFILDRLGAGRENYHEARDWGLDILKVGAARGIGGFGLWQNDSIVLPKAVDEHRCRILANGPVRSVIRLDFTGWQSADANVKVVWFIMAYAGNRETENRLLLSGTADAKAVAVGIVKHPEAPVSIPNKGRLYTLGAQSIIGDSLMLALAASKDALVKHHESEVDHLLILNLSANKPLRYYSTAQWQGEPGDMWRQAQTEAHLSALNRRLSQPLQVEYQ